MVVQVDAAFTLDQYYLTIGSVLEFLGESRKSEQKGDNRNLAAQNTQNQCTAMRADHFKSGIGFSPNSMPIKA
jgi:hypothetical protein